MTGKEMIEILNEVYNELFISTGGSYQKSQVLRKLSKVIDELEEKYESSK